MSSKSYYGEKTFVKSKQSDQDRTQTEEQPKKRPSSPQPPPPTAIETPKGTPRPIAEPPLKKALPELVPINHAVVQWRQALADLLKRALAPLWGFMGELEVHLHRVGRASDVRWLWPEKQQPEKRLEMLVKEMDGESMMSYMKRMSDTFGHDFMALFMDQQRKAAQALMKEKRMATPIGDECFDFRERTITPTARVNSTMIRQRETELATAMADEQEKGRVYGIAHEALDALIERARTERINLREDILGAQSRLLVAEREWHDAIRKRDQLQEELRQMSAAAEEVTDIPNRPDYSPAWAFELMGSSVFQLFVSRTGFAAMRMAQSMINRLPNAYDFELKELICSHSVHDRFAWLTAYNFLPGTEDDGRRRGHNAYVNVFKLRQQLADQAHLCMIWFGMVLAHKNPLLEKVTDESLRPHLPQRELVYTGRY